MAGCDPRANTVNPPKVLVLAHQPIPLEGCLLHLFRERSDDASKSLPGVRILDRSPRLIHARSSSTETLAKSKSLMRVQQPKGTPPRLHVAVLIRIYWDQRSDRSPIRDHPRPLSGNEQCALDSRSLRIVQSRAERIRLLINPIQVPADAPTVVNLDCYFPK